MSGQIVLTQIGYVRSPVTRPEDDGWDAVRSRIELDLTRVASDALAGLEDFSHIEVIFSFHRLGEGGLCTGSRHPRERTDWPRVGIFAQRASARPNRIGATVCHVLGVHGSSIEVSGLDAIDGTPVLDIKPYMREFAARGEVLQPVWATELMAGYWD